jgi:type IV secretory pathway TraG/TraD family ATPase VirD4
MVSSWSPPVLGPVLSPALGRGLVWFLCGAAVGMVAFLLRERRWVAVSCACALGALVAVDAWAGVKLHRRDIMVERVVPELLALLGGVGAFAGLRPRPGKTMHGSARWASQEEAARLSRQHPEGFVLGRRRSPGLGDDRVRYLGHMLTCAPTGAGKGVGCVIPNLLEYPGSAIVIDVKGELAAVTARRRRALGQDVKIIDPFGITRGPSSSVNLLDGIDPTSPDVASQAATLADLIVISEAKDTFWDDAARDLIRGLLIHVAGFDEEYRHMGEVRRILTGSESELDGVLADMSSTDEAFELPKRAANVFLAKAEKERSGVLSTAARHTSFLDDPRIVAALSKSEVHLEELKQRPMTVYIAIPPHKLASNTRFIRALMGLGLAGLMRTTEQPAHRVAFFFDEFAQLGHMRQVEDAISVIRGYGGVFWMFVQDLSQLQKVYPKWQSLVANAGKQFFRTSDIDTAKYISSSLGDATVEYESTSKSPGKDFFGPGSKSRSQHFSARPLLKPEEVMTHEGAIVLLPPSPPFDLVAVNYLKEKRYSSLADENPYHQSRRGAMSSSKTSRETDR